MKKSTTRPNAAPKCRPQPKRSSGTTPNWLVFLAYLAYLRSVRPQEPSEAKTLRLLIVIVGLLLVVVALVAAGAPEQVAAVLRNWPILP